MPTKRIVTPMLAVALLAASSLASAAQVVVNEGTEWILNVDLGAMGANPSAPYTGLLWSLGIVGSSLQADGEYDDGYISYAGDLNGAGSVHLFGYTDDYGYPSHGWSDSPDVMDGVFSIIYRSAYGSFVVDTDNVHFSSTPCDTTGYPGWVSTCAWQPISFSATPQPQGSAPEPASLALLGLGLAGLAAVRRRRIGDR